eukprot:8952819-Lingulodinium_polyedra.AAC.1
MLTTDEAIGSKIGDGRNATGRGNVAWDNGSTGFCTTGNAGPPGTPPARCNPGPRAQNHSNVLS